MTVKGQVFEEIVGKLLLLLRKAVLIRKHVYILTGLEFAIAIIFILQIRLIFEPQALHLEGFERAKVSKILKQMPKDVTCKYAPDNQFLTELMSEAGRLLNIQIKPVASDGTNGTHSDSQTKALWAIFTLSKKQLGEKPKKLDYKIQSYNPGNGISAATWSDDEASKEDPYMVTGFIPFQIAIEISFIEMWKKGELPRLRNKIRIGRFPYYTLNLTILPVQFEPSVVVAYCLMIIAFLLISTEVLHKVVHDKSKGFRDLLKVMGMSPSMLYVGWIFYMLIVGIPVTIIATIMLNPILINAYAIEIFTFIILYLIVSTCYMFFLGTFFQDALKACLIGTILWLVLSYISILLAEYTEDMGYIMQIATLCLPHNGLIYGLFNFAARKDIVKYNDNDTRAVSNVRNTEFDEAYDYFDNSPRIISSDDTKNMVHQKHQLPLAIILLAWLLHIIFWTLLTFYLDTVRPGKIGSAKPWYYPCKKCITTRVLVDGSYSSSTKWSHVEKPLTGLIPIVAVRQITKKFGSKKNQVIAIDNMTIDFYEGEFHIVLGHNGAGKSTLLKMIVGTDVTLSRCDMIIQSTSLITKVKLKTGMYKPSQGNIYILDKDYKRQRESRKSLISYCPQDNILIDNLTAVEHVYLFGILKGMTYEDAFEKAEAILTRLGLGGSKNERVKSFSLGMKRRVCLSMALIGNAKILVLDEPGYGVDPQNRRRIWDTLLAFREERTIIMTTSSMEAADILPERIVIIANGKVQCYGTKMYLNRRFGTAYLLTIVIENDCDLNSLTGIIQNFSSDQIKLRSRLSSVIKYDLPRRTAFTKLLQHLEHNTKLLRIKSMELNVASIEEQFRRIGIMSHIRKRYGLSAFYKDHEFEIMMRRRRHELLTTAKPWTRKEGRSLSIQQFRIMFYKKIWHVLTYWKMYGYSLLFTLLTFFVCFEISRKTNIHIITTRMNEVNISRYTASGLGILLHGDTKSMDLLKALIDVSELYNSDKKAKNYFISKDISATELITKSTWNSMEIREHYFMGIDVRGADEIDILYSVSASHSGPIAINFLHNALLRYNGCKECLITINTEPIVEPQQWQNRMINRRGIRNWQAFSIVAVLFLSLPSINLVAKEFGSSSKRLQLNVVGMSPIKYWAPIYIIDILIYVLCLLLIGSFIPIFSDVASDVSVNEIVLLLTILLMYEIAVLPMGYAFHFLARRTEIVYVILIALNVTTLTFINGIFAQSVGTRFFPTLSMQIGDILLHIFPPYVLACAVGNFLSIHVYNDQCEDLNSCQTLLWMDDPCCQQCGEQGCYRPLSTLWTKRTTHIFHHSLMIDIVIFLLDAIVFITIVFVVESRYISRIRQYVSNHICPTKIRQSITEPYVLQEKEQADCFLREHRLSGAVPSNVALSIQSLLKKFEGKAVVQEVSFNASTQFLFITRLKNRVKYKDLVLEHPHQVYKNECLGILGTSGSGKSTIFRILNREELPTSGRAVAENYDLIKDNHGFSSIIGYCPQIGGLNKFMTARQNLYLHAALRGVPLDRVQDEVDKWLDVFDLLDYETTKVKYCPWGIRRKICILQSLIGDLPIVILDEPTAGLDAIARHVVCETLQFVREMGRSLLVTTQSMEEAEILCLRIGVLIDGQLVAFGSREQLKHRHGEYFTLNIGLPATAQLDKIEEIKKSIEHMHTGFEFQSFRAGILKYQITASATKYSAIFDKLEKLKAKHNEIVDSFVSQTTMEQVFLSLCEKYQDTTIPPERMRCITNLLNKIHNI